MRYINKVKPRKGFGPPTTCGYQNCGEKTCFNVRAMFAQYEFASTVLQNILHHFFAWEFCRFTCLPITKGCIVQITNHDYDKYFSISALEKSGGTCDPKVKGKYQKKKKGKSR